MIKVINCNWDTTQLHLSDIGTTLGMESNMVGIEAKALEGPGGWKNSRRGPDALGWIHFADCTLLNAHVWCQLPIDHWGSQTCLFGVTGRGPRGSQSGGPWEQKSSSAFYKREGKKHLSKVYQEDTQELKVGQYAISQFWQHFKKVHNTLKVKTLPSGWRGAWWRWRRAVGLAAAGLERVFFLH